MRILVSGFEPFGGDVANASGDAVEQLGATWDDPAVDLHVVTLPVSFDRAPTALAAAIAATRPDAVICVGEAGGRTAVTPERWAVNERSARIPDNDGAQPSGPIDDLAPSLASRIDVDGIVEAMRAAGIEAQPSQDAGRYVCNAVFRAALTGFDGPAGFIHVPALRATGEALVGAETDGAEPRPADRGGVAGVSALPELVTALRAAVEVVSRSRA
ncbi:hypothetical protein ACFQ06_00550 [Tessaracoccus lubricantis]